MDFLHNLRGANAAFSSSARWTSGTGTSIFPAAKLKRMRRLDVGALLQALAIGFVAAVLFVAVEKIEPNRPYAYLFMFLIIAIGTLAIVELLP
jgi:hypothetical protein